MKKLLVLVSEACPHCSTVKEMLKDNQNVRILDVAKDQEARDLVARFGVSAVPALFTKDDETAEVCFIDNGALKKCSKVDANVGA